MTISPDGWESLWPKETLEFLKPLILDLNYEMSAAGLEAHFQCYTPHSEVCRQFVSVGVCYRDPKLKTKYTASPLFAFGFFVNAARRWPETFPEYYAKQARAEYDEFARNMTIPKGSFLDRLQMNEERQPQAVTPENKHIWADPDDIDPLS